MALYGPLAYTDSSATPDANGVRPTLPGAFCICEPATFTAFSQLLTPYRDNAPAHRQNTFAGDVGGLVTVTLHFPDFGTAKEVMAQVNGPVAAAPSSLPDEVAMERVLIVMAHAGLRPTVAAFIASLPEPQKTDAQILLDHAPKLEVAGTFAQGFKAFAGLTDDQWGQLVALAVNLSL